MRYKLTLTCRDGHETDCTISEDLKLHIEHCHILPLVVGYCPLKINDVFVCRKPLSVSAVMVENLKEVIE